MMRIFLAVLVSAIVLSCTTTKDETDKHTLITYEMKTFRLESSGGCVSDSTACASYEVDYPVFTGLDSSVAAIIEKRIQATADMGNPELKGKPMQDIARDFIQSFEKFTKEFPDPSGGWYYGATISVVLLNDTLLSLSTQDEYFTGGAHGGGGKYYTNLHPRTGRDITLDDLLKPGYRQVLLTLGEQEFRKVREMGDTVSYQDNNFEFPDNKFQLNQNFGFTPQGIAFYYNSYEIASYAAGPTEILIPYTALKEWMK
jgi:hypothetical protein